MKKLLFSSLLLTIFISAGAQLSRTELLQSLEKNQSAGQQVTITLKSASRLFADSHDLTSVITIIPSGSIVSVTGYDSTFLQVNYEGENGYIYATHAILNKTPVTNTPAASLPVAQEDQEVHRETAARQQQQSSRLSSLIKKYGYNIAGKIYDGKVWKGMTAEMVQDSWGSPRKITRVVSDNIIKEEWFYRTTWLYIQNNILAEWGPIK
jgi:hypothetical protein